LQLQFINKKPLLEVKGLSCGYYKKTILKEVEFTVSDGEHWAVVGDNGEGKSTLLRTLVGLLTPLGGKHLLHAKASEISLVSQHPTRELRMPMTVEDFVELGFPPGHEFPNNQKKDMVNVALNRLGIAQRKEDISILSGGQFQRTVLARALVHFPCLLFLDEPARGLDQKSNSLLMKELQCCPKHSTTAIVMVLHDLRLLRQHFSHILWLQDGSTKALETKDIDQYPDLLEFLGESR
jgi:zinc transport system ATP-binding protein